MRGLWALVLLAAVSPASAEGVGRQVIDGFVVPTTGSFVRSTAELAASVGALCDNPGNDTLTASRTAFATALDDWGHVSVLRFGPLAADGRFEKLFFWPDARGIGLKQVQGLLAANNPGEIASGLAGKSAALQGFPALEFTLHGTGSESLAAGDSWRCSVASAIASNIAALAATVAREWSAGTPFAASFSAPADGKEPYRTEAEVQGEIVKALATALQFIRSAELAPPLGEAPEKANGKRTPMWRSGLTVPIITAQIGATRRLLVAAGYEQNLPEDRRYIASSIRFELDNAIRTLGQVEGPVEQTFGTEPDRGRFAFAELALHHAGELVTRDLAAALGLTMGFNALDGD
ncbi:MAG: imelysin family protein [Pseudomonadota bacterium]